MSSWGIELVLNNLVYRGVFNKSIAFTEPLLRVNSAKFKESSFSEYFYVYKVNYIIDINDFFLIFGDLNFRVW